MAGESHGGQSSGLTALAWVGWRMPIRRQWTVLSLAGDWDRGSMMVGRPDAPLAQVRWQRPRERDFNVGRWGRENASRTAVGRPGDSDDPAPAGFRTAIWQRPAPKAKMPRSRWAGYSRSAHLLIDVVVRAADRGDHAAFCGRSLPGLRTSAPGEPVLWAVFEAGFESPPDCRLVDRRLAAGDIVLVFDGPGGQRLIQRQVYPADLALARRKLVDWLRFWPIQWRRAFRPTGEPEAWSADSFGRPLDGLIRRGRRQLPSPLGRFGRRQAVAAAVEDAGLGRLLVVESDTRGEADESAVAWAIGRMNWNRLGG